MPTKNNVLRNTEMRYRSHTNTVRKTYFSALKTYLSYVDNTAKHGKEKDTFKVQFSHTYQVIFVEDPSEDLR